MHAYNLMYTYLQKHLHIQIHKSSHFKYISGVLAKNYTNALAQNEMVFPLAPWILVTESSTLLRHGKYESTVRL